MKSVTGASRVLRWEAWCVSSGLWRIAAWQKIVGFRSGLYWYQFDLVGLDQEINSRLSSKVVIPSSLEWLVNLVYTTPAFAAWRWRITFFQCEGARWLKGWSCFFADNNCARGRLSAMWVVFSWLFTVKLWIVDLLPPVPEVCQGWLHKHCASWQLSGLQSELRFAMQWRLQSGGFRLLGFGVS